MRGIFFGLLLSNLLYLGWQLLVPRAVVAPVRPAIPAVEGERVRLVAEVSPDRLLAYPSVSPGVEVDAELAAQIESPAEVLAVVPAEAIPSLYCAEIGPFRDKADAETFIASNAERLPLVLSVRQVEVSPDYRVYLPPFNSRELAASTMQTLRNAFASNNLAIDTYLIPRGELANGIALGLFSEQRNALNVQQQMEKLGYTVVVRTEPKQKEEVWVLVENVESEAVFQQQWQQMRLSRSYVEAGEKLCETIALPR